MYPPELVFVVVLRFLAPGAGQTTYSHFLWFCIIYHFSWICYLVTTRALVMESLFYVYFRKWCSRVSQIAFHDFQNQMQNHVFSRIVNLASTRAPVIPALGCSWRVLLALGSSLGACGKCWWLLAEIIKTIAWLGKTYIFHSPKLFWTSPKTYILDHSKCMKIIVLSTSGSKARKPLNQVHGAGFDDLAQYYIRRTFYYRIIVHWITCSWVPCLLTEPAGHPRKKCVYTKLFP